MIMLAIQQTQETESSFKRGVSILIDEVDRTEERVPCDNPPAHTSGSSRTRSLPSLAYVKSGMSNKIHSIETNVPTSNDDKACMKHACSTALSALEAIIKIVEGAAGHAERRGLQTGISGLLFIIGAIKVRRYQFVLDAMLMSI
jgi:hypothetical protein